MKCYYAHCKALYGTVQEARDIKMLEDLGFEVLNPSAPSIRDELAKWQEKYPDRNVMDFFVGLVGGCSILAFRGLPYSPYIPAGVHTEVMAAVYWCIPVIELPTALLTRGLDMEPTREYLREIGDR